MRFAIYFTPAHDAPLSSAARSWIGRDAFHGKPVDVAPSATLSAVQIEDLSSFPRHYGFHGTLKAPFYLKEDNPDRLRNAVRDFSDGITPFKTAPLQLTPLMNGHRHLTLMPEDRSEALQKLADDCVRFFEPFRAPLTEDDIQRRKPNQLTERQRGYLQMWGYPYVFEDFRFHLTLSRALEDEEVKAAHDAAQNHFKAQLGQPLLVDGSALFRQDDRQSDFVVDTYCAFEGATINTPKMLEM